MKLLHVDSSILGDHSVSRGISAAAVARLVALHPGIEVTHVDLAADPVPQQSGALLAAQATAPEEQSPEVRAALAALGKRLDEFLAADIVVIGAPMYNFGIPSQLKAWIDALAIREKTFRYTETGPVGLAGGKRVVIAAAKGGFYGAGSPVAAFDHLETYLKTVFGFFGIHDVEFVRAEGIAVSPEQKQTSIDAALAEAGALRAA